MRVLNLSVIVTRLRRPGFTTALIMRLKQITSAFCLCLLAGLASAQPTGYALDVNPNNDAVRLGFSYGTAGIGERSLSQ
jgi:hypothetical protein